MCAFVIVSDFASENSPITRSLSLAVQEAVRNAQEELAKQKEVIMAQDKELKVNTAAVGDEVLCEEKSFADFFVS